jgi:hypothetical protein
MDSYVFISEKLTEIMSRPASSLYESKDKHFDEFRFVDINYESLPFYKQLPESMIYKMQRVSENYEGYFDLYFKVETTEFFSTDRFEVENKYLIIAKFISPDFSTDTEYSVTTDESVEESYSSNEHSKIFSQISFDDSTEEGELSDLEDDGIDVMGEVTKEEFICYISNIFYANIENKKLRITDENITLSYKDFFNCSKNIKRIFPSWEMAGI